MENSIHTCETYSTFPSVGSDHYVVITKVKLTLRNQSSPSSGKSYGWMAIKNTDLNSLCALTEILSTDKETISETFAPLISENEEAAKEMMPRNYNTEKKGSYLMQEWSCLLKVQSKVQKNTSTTSITTFDKKLNTGSTK